MTRERGGRFFGKYLGTRWRTATQRGTTAKFRSLTFLLLVGLFGGLRNDSLVMAQSACESKKLFSARGVDFWTVPSRSSAFFYESGMMIDADGAYRAYHPDSRSGLDSLDHAGQNGNWWALATDDGTPRGTPVLQRRSDPAPGFYVSTTALFDSRRELQDPRRYVDAANIPYVVLHPLALRHARLGDFATVVNLENKKISPAIVADVSGEDLPVGEGSIALAKRLGINPDARSGGTNTGVVYIVYANSGNGRPRSLKEIASHTKHLFERWGGAATLNACLAKR